mmetsp:Transcript_14368/g.13951  ORF Transcript_14368/g.13951 Transcript_14368/m.13951 type:complete len:84 (+) Transcript_14368:497-748(+)
MARDSEGGVWMWGSNSKGQLGVGLETPEHPLPELNNGLRTKNVRKIVCGGQFAIALGQDIIHQKAQDGYTKASVPNLNDSMQF